ncbi:MAG: hypothetical protein ACRDMJ_04710 [Solirubrobacteraceae bacterium]
MDGAWLRRARWRWRGAWLWPTFVVAIAADAVIAHTWPAAGDAQSVGSGLLVGAVLSLLAVVLCARPGAAVLRRLRPDLPVAIARNGAGALATAGVTAAILAAGLVHHATISRDRSALRDAVVRAQAFIGAQAPAEFRANASDADTFTIVAGAIYRVCVPGHDDGRWYCVIVRPRLARSRRVVADGSEPNALLEQGTG